MKTQKFNLLYNENNEIIDSWENIHKVCLALVEGAKRNLKNAEENKDNINFPTSYQYFKNEADSYIKDLKELAGNQFSHYEYLINH